MSISNGRSLLERAAANVTRLERHLLVAAAIRGALGVEAVIVGGTAEEYWTSDEYHQTDLDLCAPIGPAEKRILRSLGFQKSGRHWEHPDLAVAVEFPESEIDGDLARTTAIPLGDGEARVIGPEDLYLDRVRQATADPAETGRFQSSLAIAVTRYESMDWTYVRKRLRQLSEEDRHLGKAARDIDSKVRRRARLQLSS